MDIVTGSFGYIGRTITRALLARGRSVRTLTTHPGKPNPFGDQVSAAPYHFEDPEKLARSLQGCETFYNTYWVRFNYGQSSFEQALQNTRTLFQCARQAGVRRIVHISVTNPAPDDPLPYYRGKALQEQALRESGVDYAILRPTLVFGREDILVNNIAWTILKFPFVPVFGTGRYRVQPVFVEDLAMLAVQAGTAAGALLMDAVGPETFTYEQFLRLIARELDRRVALVHVPPQAGILLGKLIGLVVRDVLLTRDELDGLMRDKLTSVQPPNGRTLFSDWLHQNRESLGAAYTSELNRHFRWRPANRPRTTDH